MRTVVLAVVILAMCSTGLIAGDVIRVDPNTPENQSAIIKPDTDLRLATRVTYQADRKPVRQILADLTKLTGVTLNAGYNNQDWQVRDRRMNIYVKDIPLANVMDSIARVMKFNWSKNDLKDPPTYRLYMNRLSILDEKRMLEQEEKRYYERMAEKREGLFSECDRVSKLSGGEVAALESENPYLYLMATSGMGDIFRVFAGNQAAGSGEYEPNSSNLSPEDQRRLLDAVNRTMRYQSKIFRSSNGPRPEEPEPLTGELELEVGRIPAVSEWHGDETHLGPITIRQDGKTVCSAFMFDPNSEYARMVGKSWTLAYKTDRPEFEGWNKMMDDVIAAVAADVSNAQSCEPRTEHADDPRLHEAYKLDIKDRASISDVQSVLADATGLGVISDSFGEMIPIGGLKDREISLGEILDTVAKGSNYNWWLHRSVIEFRDRHWYRKRSAQIPDKWIDEWKDTLKKTGTLEIGDLAEICCLTSEQWDVNINDDDVLRCVRSPLLYNFRGPTSIYAFLTKDQIDAAITPAGFDLRMISPDNWDRVKKSISSEYTKNPDAEVRLFVTKTPNGKVSHYSFRIVAQDKPKLEWGFETPLYVEPKAKEKK